jgi:hypothetical protein
LYGILFGLSRNFSVADTKSAQLSCCLDLTLSDPERNAMRAIFLAFLLVFLGASRA